VERRGGIVGVDQHADHRGDTLGEHPGQLESFVRSIRALVPVRASHVLPALIGAILVGQRPAGAQEVELCREAARHVEDVAGMVAVTEPDTIDDWRTRAMVPGCRVTAAGATRLPDAAVARDFYASVREAGWVRTPDPRDAPNEASLRFRRDRADCLFNFYNSSSALNTEAELSVIDAVHLGPGERVYGFLVLCTPAAAAAPRG
jgi:hypothetical protein